MASEMLVMLPEAAVQLFERSGRQLPDATALLDEWATLLNPTRAACQAAAVGCADLEGWRVAARASVSATLLRAARETAGDERFVEALSASATMRVLVEDGALAERSLPVVLGLGALAAIRLGLGLEGAELKRKGREAKAEAAERRSVSEASDQPPPLSPLGRSAPWADD